MLRAAAIVAMASLIHAGPLAAQQPAPRLDLFGDPLPAGAVARFGSSRLRPGGYIRALAFSPDDKRLASWSDSGLCIWDTSDGRELGRVNLPQVKLEAMRWLVDGRGIAVFWSDKETLFVWEFTDPNAKLPKVLPDELRGTFDDRRVSTVAISPDGKWLAIGRRSKLEEPRPIEILPLTTNKSIPELKSRGIGEQPGYCTQLVFSPDSETIFAFSRTQKPDRVEPSKIAGIPDRTVSGDFADKEHLVLRRVADGAELASFMVPVFSDVFLRGPVAAIDSRRVAVGHADGKIRIWDGGAKKEEYSFATNRGGDTGGGGVRGVALSSDGRMLISTGASDHSIKRWDLQTRQELKALEVGEFFLGVLAVSNDNQLLAGGSGPIRLWQLPSGEPLPAFPGHNSKIIAVHADHSGKSAMTASNDRSIREWDLNTGAIKRVVPIRLIGSPRFSRFSDDGKELIATGIIAAADLSFFDTQTGKERVIGGLARNVPAPQTELSKTLLTGNVQILGSPSNDTVFLFENVRKLAMFDMATGRRLRTLSPPVGFDQFLSYWPTIALRSSDGKTIAILSDDTRTEKRDDSLFGLWNAETGALIAAWSTPESHYRYIAFTSDNSAVLLGGGKKGILSPDERSKTKAPKALILVDSKSAEIMREFMPTEVDADDQREVEAFALSPNGRTLAAAERNHTIWVYEFATGQVRGKLAGHANRVNSLAFTPNGQRLISAGDDLNALVWDTSPSAFAKAGAKPDATEFDRLWTDLAKTEWRDAGPAMAALAAHPDAGIAMLQSRLRPAKSPDAKRMDQLIGQLDSPKFAEREQATNDLRDMGSAVREVLLRRAKEAKSAEVRVRLTKIADGLPAHRAADKPGSPDQLRELRAVEILEHIATPLAREYLRKLAAGATGAHLTESAAAAVKRLGQ